MTRELGNRQGEAGNLLNLGNVVSVTGDYTAAQRYYEQALAISRELGSSQLEAEGLHGQGFLALRETQYVKASELLRLALSLSLEISQKQTVIESLEAFGSLFSATSRYELAIQLLGAAHSARKTLGNPLPPSRVAGVEHDQQACRSALGDAEYERCFAAGAALPPEEAAALPLES